MKSQNFRILETTGNKQYIFSAKSFKEVCNRYISEETSRTGVKAKKKDLWDKLATEASVSVDSIHAWHCGSNGPGDVSYVKSMANVLGVGYKQLMEEVLTEKKDVISPLRKDLQENNNSYTEQEVIIKVYRFILDQDRNPERIRYFDFYDEMIEFLSNHALEVSGDTYSKLCNIVIEYCSHLGFEGCLRWEALSLKYGTACWAASEMYRDEGWFDEDEEEEWTNKIYQIVADEMDQVFQIRFGDESGWFGDYVGDPTDQEYLKSIAKDIPEYDGSEITAEWEDIDIDDHITRIFDKKRMYTWLFTRILTDVFRHDFPKFFVE